MEFSWQEYWIGLPFPFPGDRPNPGIKHLSPALQADSLPSESPRKSTTKRHSTPRGPSGIPLGQSQPLTSLSEEKAHQMKYIFLKSPLGVRNLTLKLFIFYRSIFQLLCGIGTILQSSWTILDPEINFCKINPFYDQSPKILSHKSLFKLISDEV